MTDDFVARLRIRWEAMGDMANHERAAAATEIESLRSGQREMMRTIATLRAERDEARRVAIALQVQQQHESGYPNYLKETEWQTGRRIARERGWDCFKEEP